MLTPGYAPIEQYGGADRQGPWTDVYACAATVYRGLVGEKPPEATRRVQDDALPPTGEICPDASWETRLAIRKGLAIRPEQRPASAAAFSALLNSDAIPDEQTEPRTQVSPRTGDEVPTPESSTAAPSEATASSWLRDTTGFPRASADQSSPLLSAGTVGVALVVVLGSALLFGNESAVEILAYFGTWMAASVGLIVLFREGERAAPCW